MTLRFTATILLFLGAACLLLLVLGGNNGLIHLIHLKGEVSQIQGKNQELEAEIRSADEKIFALQTSDFAQEKAAREDLGLSKPGDIVYILSPD